MLVVGTIVVVLAAVAGSVATSASAGVTAAGSTAGSTTSTSTAAASTAAVSTSTFGVGVLTVTLVDPTRATAARGTTPATPSRTITVTIRYPVAGAATTAETAAGVPASGSFPLVIFVHGYDTSAATYAAMEHELAAAGFVVAAADFPLSSSALDGAAVRDAVDQAADVSFIIRTLTTTASAPTLLARTISPGAVGVVGHSDGGITAAGVAYDSVYADAKVGAAVILSGAETAFPGSWFSTASPPLLAIHGTADEVNPYSSSEQLYADATGTKYLVSVLGGSHLGPFTTDPVRSQISTLITDFLHAELQRDSAAAARVGADANVPGALSLAAAA